MKEKGVRRSLRLNAPLDELDEETRKKQTIELPGFEDKYPSPSSQEAS